MSPCQRFAFISRKSLTERGLEEQQNHITDSGRVKDMTTRTVEIRLPFDA
jgi:hypothetical protein